MPTVALKSALFDTMEGVLNVPALTWAYQDSFDTLVNGDPAGDPKVLQLSASLIRVSQAVWDYSASVPQKVTYELRLSGSGISPVSTIDALMDAINNGLANGSLSKLEILQGTTSIMVLTMDASGYHMTSGDIVVGLTGTLPLSFTQFADIADLFGQVANIDHLTRAERATLFTDLTAYSVTGLTLSDGGHLLFAVHVGATSASLTLNGLTLTATGHFPANLGQDIEVLWNMLGSGKPLDVTGFAGLDASKLTLTDAAGHVLGSVTDPLADTPNVTRVDGKIYDDVQVGSNGGDYMNGYFRDRVMLAGLDGRDALVGGLKADFLMGGSGDDNLTGKAGADKLDGGKGHDVMDGGTGADVFMFDLGDGSDRIVGFTAGEDVIQILAAAKLSDLTFTQGAQGVTVDYRTIHIFVEDVTIATLNHIENFQF